MNVTTSICLSLHGLGNPAGYVTEFLKRLRDVPADKDKKLRDSDTNLNLICFYGNLAVSCEEMWEILIPHKTVKFLSSTATIRLNQMIL
jgi:hypothetical protein